MRIIYITWDYVDDPAYFIVSYKVAGYSPGLNRIAGSRRYYVLHLKSGDKLHFEVKAVGNINQETSPITALDYVVP